MKAVLLAGIPGTGKTTIAKEFIRRTGGFQNYKATEPVQLVNVLQNYAIHVVGKYDDSEDVFQGTDKLSMAVSPNFQEFVKTYNPSVLFIEGDRLVGNKTIDFLLEAGYDIKVIVLEVSDDTRVARYKERGSDQSDQFIKSKMTKVSNISSRMDLIMEDRIETMVNENSASLDNIVSKIIEFLEV